jgi:hypothetical protein
MRRRGRCLNPGWCDLQPQRIGDLALQPMFGHHEVVSFHRAAPDA